MINPRALKSQLDPQTEQAVRRFLEVAQEQFHPKGAIVFGSRARGTHRVDCVGRWRWRLQSGLLRDV
jgi:hypothetical protein